MVESIPYDDHDVNCAVRIPESLYHFQSDTKQVFVENHSVNIVHLNVGKRIGTISYIEPAIDECTLNVKNASVGLCTEETHPPASDFENAGGGFSALIINLEQKIYHSEFRIGSECDSEPECRIEGSIIS